MTNPYCLQIPRNLYNLMLTQAMAKRPNECCGLLAGTILADLGIVTHRFALENLADDPTTEYLARPFAAHREMRALGIDVLAIYHSHPTSAAIPSRKDRERNGWGERMVFLIISLLDDPPRVRAWHLTETDATEADWMIVEAASLITTTAT